MKKHPPIFFLTTWPNVPTSSLDWAFLSERLLDVWAFLTSSLDWAFLTDFTAMLLIMVGSRLQRRQWGGHCQRIQARPPLERAGSALACSSTTRGCPVSRAQNKITAPKRNVFEVIIIILNALQCRRGEFCPSQIVAMRNSTFSWSFAFLWPTVGVYLLQMHNVDDKAARLVLQGVRGILAFWQTEARPNQLIISVQPRPPPLVLTHTELG